MTDDKGLVEVEVTCDSTTRATYRLRVPVAVAESPDTDWSELTEDLEPVNTDGYGAQYHARVLRGGPASPRSVFLK